MWINVCVSTQINLMGYLVVLAAGTKAKDEQVTVGISGCKVLPIGTTFTVEQRSVSLTLNLSTRREKKGTAYEENGGTSAGVRDGQGCRSAHTRTRTDRFSDKY